MYRNEVRGIINESFNDEFKELEMKAYPNNQKIRINNEFLKELTLTDLDLDAQSDEIVFFQQLKVMLNDLQIDRGNF